MRRMRADGRFPPPLPPPPPPPRLQGSVSAGQALLALQYVRDELPYYNATSGHNHLIAFAFDWGGCAVSGTDQIRDRVAMITHFGLSDITARLFQMP